MKGVLKAYGWSRIAFGAAGLIAPGPLAEMLVGRDGRNTGARTLMANFATRDVVLGSGLLHAVAANDPAVPWVAAGLASDLLDTVVQLREWGSLPPDRRVRGVAMSGAAAVGSAVTLALARR